MSRRFALLSAAGIKPSLGQFQARMPGAFGRLIGTGAVARLVSYYEIRALRRAEHEVMRNADRVVLISHVEGAHLRANDAGLGGRVVVIPPPIIIPEHVHPFAATPATLRYCFIGSDNLPQNASAIDTLIGIWKRLHIPVELVIFGRQVRNYDLPPGVRVHGFVADLAEVYDGRTVLLAPTRLGGGVKTKFLEAFSYGAPVVGTPITYEGVPPEPPFLTFEDIGGESGLADIGRLLPIYEQAAKAGRQLVQNEYSEERFLARWRTLLDEVAVA